MGCGYIGGRHARSLLGLPDTTLATIVDRDLARATQMRETLQSEGRPGAAEIAVTSDIESVLHDPKVDAVVISTHHDSHPSLAIAAARAGKHIVVEKPLALTNEACRDIETAVQKTGVQMVVGFQARHAPLVRRGLA